MLQKLHKVVPQGVKNFIHEGMQDAKDWIKMSSAQERENSRRLEKIKGAYKGKRCFIMGNGPSLNLMDLDCFSDELVWGSNRCYLLFDRISWRPSFFTSIDVRVVPDIAEDIKNLYLSQLKSSTFFFPSHFREERTLVDSENVYWYYEKELSYHRGAKGMFSANANHYVYSAYTVTIAAMQLAVFLGFNPIYLIGCDTNYVIPAGTQIEDGDPTKLISTLNNDINHFAPNYFGKGSKWHDPRPERMIYHYQQAKQICDSLGVLVYNATVGGMLEVFPRVDYLDLF